MAGTASLKKRIGIEEILIANKELKEVVVHTPLQKSERLSEKYECSLYLKREIFSMCALLSLGEPTTK